MGSIYFSSISGIGAPEGEEREKMGQRKIRRNIDLEFSKIALRNKLTNSKGSVKPKEERLKKQEHTHTHTKKTPKIPRTNKQK